MCWRAILTAVAFTCTFSEHAQAHEQNQIKDIVCVLVLNGLQKEDLDVPILKKLQRHNVNFDDMNTETLRKECAKKNGVSSKNLNGDEKPVTIKTLPVDENEDQPIRLSTSSLQNIIINYFNNVQKSNNNDGVTVKSDKIEQTADTPNIENFINMWNVLSKTKEKYNSAGTPITLETSTAAIQKSTNLHNENKSMEYINKVLLNFIASQQILTTTPRSATMQVNYDFIVQKLKEIIADTNKDKQSPSTVPTTFELEKSADIKINKQMALNPNNSFQYMDTVNITNQLKMFGTLKDQITQRENIHIEDQNVQYQNKRRYVVDDIPLTFMANAPKKILPQYSKVNVNTDKQIQVLSEDIIRELSESVRARVLEDLKVVITTTTKRPTSTVKHTTVKTTTTRKPSERSINDENVASKVLEKFMEMFQQFKSNRETTTLAVTKAENNRGKKIRSNNIKPASLPYPYNVPNNITAIIINPYNPHVNSVIQTLPKEPYTFLNVNLPSQDPKSVAKITQLNIFNSKNHFLAPPITIQTNSVEVPPLGLPASEAVNVVYQNIVVSTKQPQQLKISKPIKKISQPFDLIHTISDNRHRSHPVSDNYANKIYKEPRNIPSLSYPSQHDRGIFNFGTGRHDRDREYINNDYTERRKPIKYEDYGRSHYSDHNIERFHEKLERPDDWPVVSRESDMDRYRSPKLVSRHQLPLNESTKRSRYDDSHFKNFLKTQQKVNDMLERILATKTVNGPRSVETTVHFK